MAAEQRAAIGPAFLSLIMHAAFAAMLWFGFVNFRQREAPVQQLAIEAVVVDPSQFQIGAPVQPQPVEEPPPADEPEPQATPEETLPQESAAAKEQLLAAQREREERARIEREKVEAKQREEQRKRAEAEARERDRARREAELRARLADEEREDSGRRAALAQQWAQQIAARIQRAWIRPATAGAGIDCMVHVTQIPGGEVVSASVVSCNGDAAVRESIETAARRASPLPPPPEAQLFEREIEVRFRPHD
ncbi:MAG: energy transducer TonB [Steroidobacteraceae bacterium]